MPRAFPARPQSPRPAQRRLRVASVETLEARTLQAAAAFEWRMAPRMVANPDFGDAPALPNTAAYVNPPGGYEVRFDASKTPGIRRGTTYDWAVIQAGQEIATFQGRKASTSLPEGSYTVQLTVRGAKGAKEPLVADQDITVNNVVIVSIGDSYASGEGNPVRDGFFNIRSAQWAFSADPAMRLQNAKAHRSTLSAPAQFAKKLQDANPQQAITFVSVANSGATVDKGLLGPMASNVDATYTLPPEVEQAKQIVGPEKIDVLLVSIGGNDIGFSDRIKELGTASLTGRTTLAEIRKEVDADIAALPAKYAALDRAIDDLNPGRVMITTYPDPTRGDDGDYAPIRLAGASLISKDHARFAERRILTPLNQAIATAAIAHGWTAVDGYADAFRTHGYPADNSWFRSVGESLRLQAGLVGAFHPNVKGHQVIANSIYDAYMKAAEPA